MNRRGKKRINCVASLLKAPSMTTLLPRSRARKQVATTCSGVRLRPNDADSPATSKRPSRSLQGKERVRAAHECGTLLLKLVRRTAQKPYLLHRPPCRVRAEMRQWKPH